jgi:hypothetical protein
MRSLRSLASSGAREPRRLEVPAAQPLQVIKTLENRVSVYATPHSNNPDGNVGLH